MPRFKLGTCNVVMNSNAIPLVPMPQTVIILLAEGRCPHNCAPNTLASYLSANLDMFPDRNSAQ
jgi:hypothetical protein